MSGFLPFVFSMCANDVSAADSSVSLLFLPFFSFIPEIFYTFAAGCGNTVFFQWLFRKKRMCLCISPPEKPPYWFVCLIAGSFKLCPDLIVFLLCFLAYVLHDLALSHIIRHNQVLIYQIICCLVCIVVSDIVDALCRYFRL